jgi:hypothetical protein
MNIKTTLVLAVLVGAGVLLWWLGGPQLPSALDPVAPPAPGEDRGTRAFLRGLQPTKISHIEVNAPGGITALDRKADGTWGMPGNWPIREAEVAGLLDLLSGLRSRFEPEALSGEKKLEDYGLDHPAVTVKLTTSGKEHALALGEKPAKSGEDRFSRDTYLRLDDKPEVVRLAPGLIAALDRPTDYYQQRRLFRGERVVKESTHEKAEQLAAQRVTVEDKKPDGSHFTLTRRGKEWELAEPVRDRLDSASRDALLAAVPDIWAEQFVPLGTGGITGALLPAQAFWNPASVATHVFFATQGGLLVRAGLTSPERILTVKYDKGDTITLLIGSVSGRRTRLVPAPQMPGRPPGPQRMMPVTEEYRYAKLPHNEQIFEIKGDKLKDVFVALDGLRDARIARFNSTDARRVEIKHGGEDIVLEKDKEQWKLVKPLSADADTSKVTDLLNKLSDLQARDKDVLDKADPKTYGLDKPSAQVVVTVEEEAKDSATKEKKTRTLTVRVGKHDADKKKLYVMADDWPRINVVEDALEPLVSRPALAYRGKRLFDFASSDVAKIEIENQGKKCILERDKGEWRLTNPVKAEADSLKVDPLVDKLSGLEAVEYVNQTPKQDDLESMYGLGKPHLIVKIEFSDKKKPARVLHIGKARGGKGGYFAQQADSMDKPSPVFAVSAEIHNELTRDTLSYRPLKLWQMPPEEIASLRIHKEGQKEYTLAPAGAGWKISGPFEANAQADAVRKMTTELGAPQIESYKAHEAKDLAAYGLDKPAVTVTVKAKDGKEHTLLIGGPNAKDTASRFAKRANEPAIFQVGDALVRAADRGPLDLLDTSLWNLAPDRVERMRVQSDGTRYSLEKKGDAWRVAESPAGDFPADSEVATSLGLLWSNLRAERFADYGGSVEWAKYGLDKPAVSVTVHTSKADGAAGNSEHTVELGKDVQGEPGARYARVDKGSGVAVLPPETARLFARTYLDYVNRNLLKFDSGAVVSLQRHMGADVLEVVKKNDAWEVAKPKTEKADEKGMQDLLGQLGELRAERIAAYPVKDLKEYGLDRPAALLTIRLNSGPKSAEHIIKLGKKIPPGTGGERFALVDDSKAVAVLPAALAERLAGSPLTFRDRSIARFGDADRLRLERGPRTAVFSKVDGTWKLTEPLQGEAEQDQLDDFLNSLARLRADALVAEKATAADLKKYGLDRPEARWRLQSGDREVLNLLVGNPEAKTTRRYAKLAGGDLVFLLDPRLSAKVLDEYRPRTVWTPALDAVQIESLNYRYSRQPFLLEKVESVWQTIGKPDAKLNTATVEDTLGALAGLKLSRYAVDKGANLALFGLDKPELVLEVATRSGKRLLHVGNTEGSSKRRYARIPDPDRSDVFVLDEASCDRILRDLAAFGKPPSALALPRPAR